jgi:hypothetical protein
MNDQDKEKLLEASLWGHSPGEVFRARVLVDSTEAFLRARRRHARRRFAALGVAATLVAGVSFFLGRCSVPVSGPQVVPRQVVVEASQTVVVSDDLVAWLQAAQLFKQLGMEDRMARAVERAGWLLPDDAAGAFHVPGESFTAAGRGTVGSSGMSGPGKSCNIMNRIMAQSLGGHRHADETD